MKQMKKLVVSVLLGMSASLWAADYHVDGNFITIPVKEVKAGGAKVHPSTSYFRESVTPETESDDCGAEGTAEVQCQARRR